MIANAAKTKVPKGLGDAGKAYWTTLNAAFEFSDTDLPLVETLCHLVDRLVQIRDAIAKEGVIVKDRFGINKANPMLEAERSTGLAASRIWRELGCGSAEQTDPSRMPAGRGYR